MIIREKNYVKSDFRIIQTKENYTIRHNILRDSNEYEKLNKYP